MVEKAKNMCTWKAKKIEFGESGKYVNFETDGKDKVGVKLNHDKINKDKKIAAGYNMIVTSEIDMSVNEIYDSYHHLWRIEESFKIMKSELDGRPVFVQDKYTIIGHFLSCYLCVLLERLLEFVILDNNFNYKDIISMSRKLNLVKEKPARYINIAAQTDLIKYLNSVWQITNLFAIIPLKLIIIYVNINKYVIINAGYIRDIEKYPAFYWRTYVLQGKK